MVFFLVWCKDWQRLKTLLNIIYQIQKWQKYNFPPPSNSKFPNTKPSWNLVSFVVYSDVLGWLACFPRDSCLNWPLTGSWDCERGRTTTRAWGRKNSRGQIEPESCSSHYIKEGGYVTPVGSRWGTRAKRIQMSNGTEAFYYTGTPIYMYCKHTLTEMEENEG